MRKKIVFFLTLLCVALMIFSSCDMYNESDENKSSEKSDICKNGHTKLQYRVSVEPTCSSNGTKEVICLDCGKIVDQISIEKIAHKYQNRICSVCGELEPSEGLSFKELDEGKSYAIEGIGTCKDTDIVLPSTHMGKPVTEIYWRAFKDCSNLTSIKIPESITRIEGSAFEGCTGLIEKDGNVSYVDKWVIDVDTYYNDGILFTEIPQLRKDTLGIADGAFLSAAFDEIVLPDSVRSIGHRAFKECTKLKTIHMPKNLKIIHNEAFWECRSLEEVVLPEGVTEIGGRAFELCTSLREIVIPDSAWLLDYGAFRGCTALETAIIGNGVKGIEEDTFSGCKNLKNVSIGNSVEHIGKGAFYSCTELEEIILPDSLLSIRKYAFRDCNKLCQVEDGVTYVDKWVIGFDQEQKEVTLRSDTVGIGTEAFYGADIEQIVLPESVRSIDAEAFLSCSKLKSITIPLALKNVGFDAFEYCHMLNEVFYAGSEEDWKKIDIEYGNGCPLYRIKKHYNTTP